MGGSIAHFLTGWEVFEGWGFPLMSTSAVMNDGLRPYFGSELRKWYADAGNCTAEQANIVVIGDSVGVGASVSAPPSGYSGTMGPNRWVEVMLRQLQNAKGTGRGSVFKPTTTLFDNGTSGAEWTHSGTIAYNGTGVFSGGPSPTVGGGLGINAVDIGASTSNYVETVQECDSFQIWYPTGLLGGMGDFSVLVDGVTVATVDVPQTGSAWAQIWDSVTAGVSIAPGKHTIRVKCAVTGTVIIEGGIFFNGDRGTGVHVYNGSHGGYASSHFVTNTNWAQSAAAADPSLVIYNVGLNDLTLGTSIATFKANTHTILDAIKNLTTEDPSELVMIPWAHAYDDGGVTYSEHPEVDWLPYRQALYDVADLRGAAVLDVYSLFGYAKAASDTADVFTSDEIHLNDRGHRTLGTLVADWLLGTTIQDRGHPTVNLSLTAETPPAATGSVTLKATDYAGRGVLEVRGADGASFPAGFPFTKSWMANQPGATGGGLNHLGANSLGSLSAGTATPGGPGSGLPRYVGFSTAASSNTGCAQGDTDAQWYRGAGSNYYGAGFFFATSVSIPTTLVNQRVFIGLTSGTAASTVTGSDPGNEHVGLSYVSGTANWQISTRDGTTNTKSDTGIAVATSTMYDIYLWLPANGSTLTWVVRDNSGFGFKGTKATNLPATGTFLRRAWAVQTTEAVAKEFRVYRVFTMSDK